MSLEESSQENLAFIIKDMGKILQVVNTSLMEPDDYDLAHYDELKSLYDLLQKKQQLTVAETQAFIAELRQYRKN
ncbi:hypothetical protein J416_00964 [Gracilibacillus halophilus YIM-C55.5]|uniref:Uncharacterized protein n=1 Tax=Gracilibacillus halophilus YIM-C55.5 TaxID=1308866 RepID=N4WV71_9BACI|nr:DUF1128 domain-containing protein [Gracilibacillus halophilus]ENH98270.1 hypothetical protein J416_00964 [Gracilibacillus halophilus YIM-C55.5]